MDGWKQQAGQSLDLEGARILVVEDEFYIADDFRRILRSAGAVAVGAVSTFGTAMNAVESGDFDCAVIDLNLRGESAVPAVDRLVAAGKSFAIATGYGSGSVPERLSDIPEIEQPLEPERLVRALASLGCARSEPVR